MTVRYVLLVPAQGDPGGLLREGPCGARPPTVDELERLEPSMRGIEPAGECRWGGTLPTDWHSCRVSRRALVLAWDGEPVPEGCDRAWRAVGHTPCGFYLMPDAARIAQTCEAAGLGTAVIVEET